MKMYGGGRALKIDKATQAFLATQELLKSAASEAVNEPFNVFGEAESEVADEPCLALEDYDRAGRIDCREVTLLESNVHPMLNLIEEQPLESEANRWIERRISIPPYEVIKDHGRHFGRSLEFGAHPIAPQLKVLPVQFLGEIFGARASAGLREDSKIYARPKKSADIGSIREFLHQKYVRQGGEKSWSSKKHIAKLAVAVPMTESPSSAVLDQLLALRSGWDGQGGVAPTSEAKRSLIGVVGCIPDRIVSAEVEVDADDGQISFAWYGADRRSVVMLHIQPSGRVLLVKAAAGEPAKTSSWESSKLPNLPRALTDAF